MAVMAGKDGKVIWDAAATDIGLTHVQSWSCTYTHDIAEITSMQETYRTYFTGHQDWTATAECLLPTGALQIPLGSTVTGLGMVDDTCQLELYFHHETGTKFRAVYGEAICTGESIGETADGIATITYAFQGNGQLQWYTSSTVEPGE